MGGSDCKWMEKHYAGKIRSLKLQCECPASSENYHCEYIGNPHLIKGAYAANPFDFYKDVAKFVASKESELYS